MRDGHIRHLVVFKSGKPVGMVSERDLIHLIAEEAETYKW
ncbi:CBS domain-containing protein [bacterium]|nr:CBS domain-containing protein [bacterium]